MAILEDTRPQLQLFNRVSFQARKQDANAGCKKQVLGTVGEQCQEPFGIVLSINLQCVSLSLGVMTYI